MQEIIQCISPVDGSVYIERPAATDSEISSILAKSRQAQQQWRSTSINERRKACIKALDALIAMKDDLAPELSWQMGRPVQFAGNEMNGVEERVRYICSVAEQALAPVNAGDIISTAGDKRAAINRYVGREPAGIVFIIAPWNYPYLTTVNTIFPALMAGNSVILKHSEQTMLVGERFAKAFADAGLPDGLLQNVHLSHASTEKIISSGSVNHVNFTGSVAVGRKMERIAAGTFTTLGLELGGKDPAYVRADADIDFTIANLVDGAFFNSGQCCCGIERVYVDEKIYDQVLEGLIAATNTYILGNPLDTKTTLGPLAKTTISDFIRRQIDEAVAQGAVAHIDPKKFGHDDMPGNYMPPQIVSGVNHDMSLMRDESFGPVFGIMKVKSDQQALELMNDSDFGLTASIWSNDLEVATTMADQLVTGTVYLNRCDYIDPTLVWTGFKDTGRGATMSVVGYEYLTRPKSFYFRQVF